MTVLNTLAITAVVLMATTVPLSADANDTIHANGEKPTLYYNLRLIDPVKETITDKGFVLVENGLIRDLGTRQPSEVLKNTLRKDMQGRYALPGLIDTHAHVTLGPVELVMDQAAPFMKAPPRFDIARFNAQQMLSFGVTTVRNPGGAIASSQHYVRQISTGKLHGPEMLYAGEVIDRSATRFEGLVTRPEPGQSISEIVDQQAAQGVHYIKLYEALNEQDLREGIAAAHRHGLKAIAHLSDVSWLEASGWGIDALVHAMPISPDLLPESKRSRYLETRRPGSFAFFEWYEAVDLDGPKVRAMIAALVEQHVHVDATLSAFYPAFFGDQSDLLLADKDYMHPDMLANWAAGFRFDLGWAEEDYQRAQAIWPKVLKLTRMLFEAGVPLTIGTDFSMPYVAPGLSMMREMQRHQAAGIAPWDLLRMATSTAAQALDIAERTGSLRIGLEADVLFLEDNPLEDLEHLRSATHVLNNGQLHRAQALRERAWLEVNPPDT